MKFTVGPFHVCVLGTLVVVALYFTWKSPSPLLPAALSAPVPAQPLSREPDSAELTSVLEPHRVESVVVPVQGVDGVSNAASWSYVAILPDSRPSDREPQSLQYLSAQRVRIAELESRVARLEAELEACRHGSDSPLATLRSLPDWAELTPLQRISVVDFVQRFPVRLGPGEATLIATYSSPTGDTIADLIGMLGRSRVLASLSPDARQRFETEDPDEFREYFGVR